MVADLGNMELRIFDDILNSSPLGEAPARLPRRDRLRSAAPSGERQGATRSRGQYG